MLYIHFSEAAISDTIFHITLEKIAVVAGLVCLYLAARANIWNWLFGTINVSLYAFIFYHKKLYGDMSLHIIYLLFQYYGWYQWRYGGKNATELSVTKTPKSQYYILSGILVGLFLIYLFALKHYTNSTTPYVDSFTTAFGLIAQWMMCRKWLENWWLWIFMDLFSLYICADKHLYWMTSYYFLSLILCIIGYREWKKKLR